MSIPRLIGVLLAAGKGTRVGRTKQLIEMPSADGQTKPLVALAFDAISESCRHMVVVLDADKDRVIAGLGQRSFLVATASGTRQMSESAVAGLRVANSHWPGDSVLLQLGDHPSVRPETVSRLCVESNRYPGRTIIPTFDGKGGHPILIPPAVIERILSEHSLGALSAYWRTHPELCVRCEVDDDAVVRDLDHPAQLAAEVRRRSQRGAGS